jgi:hypothetical protein
VRSRFLGASSYDDDEDENEAMDMSGFIGSTTVEQPPLVVERKRTSREPVAVPTPTGDSGMGNVGPRSVPPPQPRMSNMGYAPSMVSSAAGNTGSPWNPLWASDDSMGPNILPVILKCAGLAGVFGGGVYSAGSRSIAGVGGKMMVAGTAAYLHPALGFGQGQISNWMGDRAKWQVYGSSILVNGIGGYVFYRILTR